MFWAFNLNKNWKKLNHQILILKAVWKVNSGMKNGLTERGNLMITWLGSLGLKLRVWEKIIE